MRLDLTEARVQVGKKGAVTERLDLTEVRVTVGGADAQRLDFTEVRVQVKRSWFSGLEA